MIARKRAFFMRGFYRVRLKPDPTKAVEQSWGRPSDGPDCQMWCPPSGGPGCQMWCPPSGGPDLNRFSEPRLKDFAVAAAERQTGTGSKEHNVFAIERRLHFLDAIDVDDRRAVDPDELLRVELRFEMAHRVAHEMLLRPDVDAHVISLRLTPVDVGHAHEMNPPAGLDHQPVWARGPSIQQRRFRR